MAISSPGKASRPGGTLNDPILPSSENAPQTCAAAPVVTLRSATHGRETASDQNPPQANRSHLSSCEEILILSTPPTRRPADPLVKKRSTKWAGFLGVSLSPSALRSSTAVGPGAAAKAMFGARAPERSALVPTP